MVLTNNNQNKAAFLIRDFFQGKNRITIKNELKSLVDTASQDCKQLYLDTRLSNNDSSYVINVIFSEILDGLGIGGCHLHRSLQSAQQKGYKNCYIWEDNELHYIDTQGLVHHKKLIDKTAVLLLIKKIAPYGQPPVLYLTEEQAFKAIEDNTHDRHKHDVTDQKSTYLKCQNLYEALKALAQKHQDVNFLIDWIDSTRQQQVWWQHFMLATVFTATIGIAGYLKDKIPLIESWVNKTLPVIYKFFGNTANLVRKTPLINIIYNGYQLIYSWYKALNDYSFSDSDKFTGILFRTLEHGLPLTGYVLCYLAMGAMTIPAVFVFITTAVINTIEPFYTLRKHARIREENPQMPAIEYVGNAQKIRGKTLQALDLSMFINNVTANTLITTSVVIWCLYPQHLFISISCAIFSSLVDMTKNSRALWLKDNYLKNRQENLKENFRKSQAENITRKIIYGRLNKPELIDSENQTAPGDSIQSKSYNYSHTGKTQSNLLKYGFTKTNTQRAHIDPLGTDSSISGLSIPQGI